MESSYDESRSPHLKYKPSKWDESQDNPVGSKMAELIKTKEELKKARESTMQLWLDSKPLIDELERLKSNLASAQNRSATPITKISELKEQLDATHASIKAKKDEELKVRNMIDETNQALDQTRREIVSINLETEEEHKAIARMMRGMRLRRQTLRTLHLTLRAVRIEKDAIAASAAEALQYMNYAEMDHSTVTISHEDYPGLMKRAQDENSLSDWRVLVCTEQKLTAEANRDKASARLDELYAQLKARAGEIKEEEYYGGGQTPYYRGEQTPRSEIEGQLTTVENQRRVLPMPTPRYPREQRRIRREDYMKLAAKVKPSYLKQIKHFLGGVCLRPQK